jgi:hypothetical protein
MFTLYGVDLTKVSYRSLPSIPPRLKLKIETPVLKMLMERFDVA